MTELTEKEQDVVKYFLAFQKEQDKFPIGPTARQVARACGLSGPGRVFQIWTKLKELGILLTAPNRTAHQHYVVTPQDIPNV